MKKSRKGANNPNWKGGISHGAYSKEWIKELQEEIRKRDNYECQECGAIPDDISEAYKALDIHHIDYDKHNCDPKNLVTLCRRCHMKTNKNRIYWEDHFTVI